MLQPGKPNNSHQSIGTRQTGDKASSKPAFNQTAGGLTPFQANWYLKLDEFGGVFYCAACDRLGTSLELRRECQSKFTRPGNNHLRGYERC